MKPNFTNTLIKILYVVIALTSFLLVRQYTIENNQYVDNSTGNHIEQQSTRPTNSSFYELEGEDYFYGGN